MLSRCRRELNTETDLLREGLRLMHAKIRALPKANGADPKSSDGFKRGTNPNQAIIRADAFKGWFPDVRQPNVVLKFLRTKNALPSRPTPKSGIGIVWAESQPKWPDGTRRRSIVIDERPGQLKIYGSEPIQLLSASGFQPSSTTMPATTADGNI
jgi:hypothetical protein